MNVNYLNKLTRKRLRIVSWNIQDLGLGFKGLRPTEVKKGIARIIDAISPDVCVVIEVLRVKQGVSSAAKKKKKNAYGKQIRVTKKGKSKKKAAATTAVVATPTVAHPGLEELDGIVKELNGLSKQKWAYRVHPDKHYTGLPGKETDPTKEWETYAFIYKDNGDISIDPKTLIYIAKGQARKGPRFPD